METSKSEFQYHRIILSCFLPFGKADDATSPALSKVRGKWLQLHHLTPWIWSILDFCNVRVNKIGLPPILAISPAKRGGFSCFRGINCSAKSRDLITLPLNPVNSWHLPTFEILLISCVYQLFQLLIHRLRRLHRFQKKLDISKGNGRLKFPSACCIKLWIVTHWHPWLATGSFIEEY